MKVVIDKKRGAEYRCVCACVCVCIYKYVMREREVREDCGKRLKYVCSGKS